MLSSTGINFPTSLLRFRSLCLLVHLLLYPQGLSVTAASRCVHPYTLTSLREQQDAAQ